MTTYPNLLGSAVSNLIPTQAALGVRCRSTDAYGLELTTNAAAAEAYCLAVGKMLRVRAGAEADMRRAIQLDPYFALAHAGLALLGHEYGAAVDVPAAVASARRLATSACTERERSHVAAVWRRITGSPEQASRALLAHIRTYPLDALAVSVAVPTIAFAGVTEVPAEAWALVESLAPAYGNDWWYAGLLAFTRTDQERWDEAAELAQRALAAEPDSGHAVHALAHVHFETNDHLVGLSWLDRWVTESGPGAHHRAHFSWHAALHELALGHDSALRHRYETQLAPPAVVGLRSLVDSASLLWRAGLEGAWEGELPIDAVLVAAGAEVLATPATPFAAMHAAVALAAADDAAGLAQLESFARGHARPVFSGVVAPVVEGFKSYVEGDFAASAETLLWVEPCLVELGGSAAQREVVQDTLLHALLAAGRFDQALAVLERRLDRRPSRRDLCRLSRLESLAE